MKRRQFLGTIAAGAAACSAPARASAPAAPREAQLGMLVDTTECIGCRKCEFACNREHHLNALPLEAYEETAVYDNHRRPDAQAFTVVNRFDNADDPERPLYVKTQCMHCLEPGCVSACLVGALTTEANGIVAYDADKCLGCRYCMLACPFDVPAYEFKNAFTPKVQKCSFCMDRVAEEGGLPGCAEMCPPMCLTFGKREELLALAHEKQQLDPERYADHIYGEHEAGGTSWLYLMPRGIEDIGLPKLPEAPVPGLTQSIQHGVFKFGMLPVMVFGLFGAARNLLGDTQPHDVDGGEQ